MLVPTYLRMHVPNAQICWFLHIPWPSSEIYRYFSSILYLFNGFKIYRGLAVRKEILYGLLDADLLGFQTHTYAKHFTSACIRYLN